MDRTLRFDDMPGHFETGKAEQAMEAARTPAPKIRFQRAGMGMPLAVRRYALAQVESRFNSHHLPGR